MTLNHSSNQNITIQGFRDNNLTLNINGEVKEILNELAELKKILKDLNTPSVQYADKIYNIEHIDEAHFGFLTGKRAFNTTITKQLIESIREQCADAELFLNNVETIPNWETKSKIVDQAKQILAYSFVGVIGTQLRQLMAIGKEVFSESKERIYIEKCITITKRSLDLVCFTFISVLWDELKKISRVLNAEEKSVIEHRFNYRFELSIKEQSILLTTLIGIFSKKENNLPFPFKEVELNSSQFLNDTDFDKCCQVLQSLNDKLDNEQTDILDCFEAENQLTIFLKHFNFLVNYKMISIKKIGVSQWRNTDPFYLHSYTTLGINSMTNIDIEKLNYTTDTVATEAVLLYSGKSYEKMNINLSPFVIDINALNFEHGSKICFYQSRDINDSYLNFLFLDDDKTFKIERMGIQKGDSNLNELMLIRDSRKILNMDRVFDDFQEAKQCLTAYGIK